MESPNVPSFEPSRFRFGLDPGTCSGIASARDRAGGWRIDDVSPLEGCLSLANNEYGCFVLPAPARPRTPSRCGSRRTSRLSPFVGRSMMGSYRQPPIQEGTARRASPIGRYGNHPLCAVLCTIRVEGLSRWCGYGSLLGTGRVGPARPISAAIGGSPRRCRNPVGLSSQRQRRSRKCFGIELRERRGARRSWKI